jgi:N-acetylmuramoyl-L-alanine amidase
VPIATAGAIVIMLAATYLAVQLRRPAPPPAQTNPAPTVSGGQALAAQSTLPPSAAPPASKVATLEAVRFVSRPDSTTVQLELSRKVEVRRGRLTHPERVYFDLLGTRMATSLSAVPDRGKLIEVADPQVSRIRVAEHAGGITRVVVDLKCRCEDLFVQFPEPPYRLVIDIRAAPRHQVRAVGAPIGILAPAPSKENSTVRAAAHRIRIVLDPGHGGSDPGAEGFAVEKAVTLDIARQVALLLRERVQADVVLTRAGDATLPLAARTARANAEAADLFVSIHANASRSRRLHGVETYVLDNTTDHATMRLAAMENGLDLITPRRDRADLRYILSDLVQVGKMEESAALASAVQRALVRHLASRYRGIADLGVKRGPFYVLVGAYMPCVLVETSFLTHPAEGRRLAGREYRAAVAEGIYAGIARFLAETRRARTL